MRVISHNWIPEHEKQKKGLFLLLFSITFFVLYLLTYAVFFRNGKSYIWYYDGIKQHYAALVYLGKYYREVVVSFAHGEFTLPMFDFSIGMGEDIITTLNFYGLGDPLTLLAAIVPDSQMEKLYDFLVIFRMYLAGLSFAYMCREKGKSDTSAFLGGMIYCFCGYALHVAVKHPFFMIPMIFLPLSVIGVERALEHKKLTMLIGMVFLTALNGFYFFYMNTVFLVLYAVIHVVCSRPNAPVRRLLRCVAAYIVGMAMAAGLFVPAVAAYAGSVRSDSASDPGHLLFFSPRRYLIMLSRVIGTPRVTWDYLGLAAVLIPAMVVLFYGRFKKNIELKVNIIIWTLLMLVPLGGYALNGFSYVSGRFMYLVTFIYVMGIVEALPEILQMSRRTRLLCVCVAVLYGVGVLLSGDGRMWYGWFGFAMLAVTLAVLHVAAERQLRQEICFALLAGVVAVNVVGNGWLLFWGRAQGYVEEFVDAGTAQTYLQDSPEAELSVGDDGFFRVDAAVKSTENAAMVYGGYGVSSYFSLTNPNRIRYLSEMEDGGVLDSMFKISGLDRRTFLETLASVKYYVVPVADGTDGVPYGFRFVRKYVRGGTELALYENENFLPLGITFDSYIRREDVEKQTGLWKQEGMLKTVVLEEDVEGMTKLSSFPESDLSELPYTVVKTKHMQIDGDRVEVQRGGGTLTLAWNPAEEGERYVRLGKFKITQDNKTVCDITMSCGNQKKTVPALSPRQNWYFGREDYLLNMGLTDKNRCRIHFSCGGTFSLADLNVYVQKMVHYSENTDKRKEDVLANLSVEDNGVQGEITLSEQKLLFLSIPYSEGWKALVDGRETKIYRADTAYMAIALEPGSHQIILRYGTPYAKAGGVVTLFGIAGFVLYLWMAGKKEKEGKRGA